MSTEIANLPETTACAICGGVAHHIREERPYPVGRWSVVVADDFYRCEACEEEFYTPAQSKAVSRHARERAREEFGLLFPEEIRALRERLGLTQAQFEALLGVGRNTVVRWENGHVYPNAATNALLRLLEANPENARLLADWHRVEIGTAA